MNSQYKKPVLGFAAYSGTGKTTLLVKLLPVMNERGLRVAMIKHAHHNFDIDQPGKDSYELRVAGAQQILIASDYRRALVTETPGGSEPALADLVNSLDLVLVEGYRHLPFPKIELHRPVTGKSLIYKQDENVIAVACDEKINIGELPLLDLNRPEQVVDFIQTWLLSGQD